jgi:AraC-like DNA-binding protein
LLVIEAPLKTIVDPAVRPSAGAIVQDHFDLDCPWHRHDMHQLQYAIEGSVEVEDAHARYLLPRTLAAWIPAGVTHRTSLHKVRSGSVLFTPDQVPETGDRVRIVAVDSLMRAMLIGAMRWPLDGTQDATGRAYFTALAALCCEWVERDTPLALPTTRNPQLLAALEMTRSNLAGKIVAACDAGGLSERTLRRRCRSELGMTWEAYRHRARMLAAAALLNDTVRPIGAIAASVGFENQSSFAAAFRKLTGKTPRMFRR